MKKLASFVRHSAKRVTYDVLCPAAYRLRAWRPLQEKHALFVEMDSPKPSDSLTQVLQELENRGFVCEFISLGRWRSSALAYARNCVRMAWHASRVRAVFICEACFPLASLPMRHETSVVQLWHGCGAFKKFGVSTEGKLFGASREQGLRFPEHHNTSLVTVSSPEVRWAYIEAMGLEETPQVVQALGVSRTDVYFDEDFVDAQIQHAAEVVHSIQNKKVLLYAPTFRGDIASASAPDSLDINLLRKRLSDDWVLLVKHHPHVATRPPVPAGCEDFAFDVTDSLSIEACLCAADACVSDYSSLVFEYSLLCRPMAFFAFDKEDYDDWRGFYYDYDELTPGPVLQTSEQVADWVVSLEDGFDPTEVIAFKDKFMSACDGNATVRILNMALH